MFLLLLILVPILFLLCCSGLLQIRDEIRYGIVISDIDDFFGIVSESNAQLVFRKTLSNSRSGRLAYTIVDGGNRYTFFSFENIDEFIANSTKIVERSRKII